MNRSCSPWWKVGATVIPQHFELLFLYTCIVRRRCIASTTIYISPKFTKASLAEHMRSRNDNITCVFGCVVVCVWQSWLHNAIHYKRRTIWHALRSWEERKSLYGEVTGWRLLHLDQTGWPERRQNCHMTCLFLFGMERGWTILVASLTILYFCISAARVRVRILGAESEQVPKIVYFCSSQSTMIKARDRHHHAPWVSELPNFVSWHSVFVQTFRLGKLIRCSFSKAVVCDHSAKGYYTAGLGCVFFLV